jgi:hypothetical protein
MTNKTNKTKNRILLALLVAGASAAASAQSGPQLTTLYTFTDLGPSTGFGPYYGLTVGKGGVLYGATVAGGKSDDGVVFALTPPKSPGGSWNEQVLHSFSPSAGDVPDAPLVLGANGILYGCTSGKKNYGARANNGVVYSLTPPSAPGQPWEYKILYNFGPPVDAGPDSIAVGSDGSIFGFNESGGTNFTGSLFSLTPPASSGGAWTESTLYSFPDNGNEGFPGNLVMGAGVLYGTGFAAKPRNAGMVFSLTPPSSAGGDWTQTTLAETEYPANGLAIGSSGTLYGTITLGGPTTNGCEGSGPCGIVFALTPPASPGGAWTEETIYSFTGGADGFFPTSELLAGAGDVLYGATELGGPNGYGTLFSLTPPASPGGSWTKTVLYSFSNVGDGGYPNGVVFGPGGVLYGTTEGDGETTFGTVFALRL